MTATTQTIADFLLARLADTEYSARDSTGWASLRVLRQVEAMRKVVQLHGSLHVCPGDHGVGFTDYADDMSDDGYHPCPTLRALAAIYSDHPDYRAEEWA